MLTSLMARCTRYSNTKSTIVPLADLARRNVGAVIPNKVAG